MTTKEINLWDLEEPISEYTSTVDVPRWIDQKISPSTVAAIVQGGCQSGAYMLACTYREALKVMTEHGDDVLQYLEDAYGELPKPKDSLGWAGLACYCLTTAVELWACGAEQEITEALEAQED